MNAFKNGAKNEVHTFGYPCPLLSGTAAAQNGEVELENLKGSLWPEYDQDRRGRKKPAGAKASKKKAPFKSELLRLLRGLNAGQRQILFIN